MSVFSRVEGVILITAIVLFSIFIVFIIYRLCVLTVARLQYLYGNGNGRRNRDAGAQRVQNLLSRPGIRSIMATKAQNAKVEEAVVASAAAEAAERQMPVRTRPSVVQFSPDPPTMLAGPASPPPPYESDAMSVDSGPPPSYHSQMGNE